MRFDDVTLGGELRGIATVDVRADRAVLRRGGVPGVLICAIVLATLMAGVFGVITFSGSDRSWIVGLGSLPGILAFLIVWPYRRLRVSLRAGDFCLLTRNPRLVVVHWKRLLDLGLLPVQRLPERPPFEGVVPRGYVSFVAGIDMRDALHGLRILNALSTDAVDAAAKTYNREMGLDGLDGESVTITFMRRRPVRARRLFPTDWHIDWLEMQFADHEEMSRFCDVFNGVSS